MICKLIVLAACAVAVFAQADKYPAGVNPALCPNYPHCDNVLLALHGNSGTPVVATARQWPAGVHPAACPNYPYCDNGAALPATFYTAPLARQWPAGVHPAACPNYPYC